MPHLFLSPHPDDAVLSCGGLIAQLAADGQSVRVLTVMAGPMPSDVPINPFIQEHLDRWKLGADPVPGRRAEDLRALESLGATVLFGEIPDALYRTDGRGTALYPNLARLFGVVHPDDPVTARGAEITRHITPGDTLYVPLGAGGHVDHCAVRQTILAWLVDYPELAIFFYEEYPYSAGGEAVIRVAQQSLGLPVLPLLNPITESALHQKTAAIACYASQINSFWPGIAEMAHAVRHYAEQVGQGTLAERLWRFA